MADWAYEIEQRIEAICLSLIGAAVGTWLITRWMDRATRAALNLGGTV